MSGLSHRKVKQLFFKGELFELTFTVFQVFSNYFMQLNSLLIYNINLRISLLLPIFQARN